ncbi:MAG: transporter substrate-binding domain-containing protein [Nitrospirae bacterium YQR-1]
MTVVYRNCLSIFLAAFLVFTSCVTLLVAAPELFAQSGNTKVELTAEERGFLKGKQFRLGIDSSRPPFEFIDEKGHYKGMSAEFILELARRLDLDIIVQKDMKWKEAVESTKTGGVDIIPKITPSDERRKFLLFTKPYTTNPSVIVAQHDRKINGLSDLNGLKTGVVKGLIIESRLKTEHPELSLVQLPDVETALRELSTGNIDALIDNLGTVAYNIDKIGLSNLEIVSPTPYTHDLAVGVRKDMPLLASALDKALQSMTEQEKRQIKDRWVAVKVQTGINWRKLWPVALAITCLIIFFILWNRQLRNAVLQRKHAEAELKKYTESLERSSLIKSEVAAISADIQSSQSLEEMSEKLLSHITPLINADYGVLYVYYKDEGLFKAAGSYGYERDLSGGSFAPGQGFVGQCALDKLPINIDAPAKDYINITCGFGKLSPVCVTIQPVIHSGTVTGVIELAGLSPFVPDYQFIIDELMPVVAMNLVIIERNLNTQRLMELTNKQKEQYQALFEFMQDAVMTLAPPQWMFTSANPATLKLFRVQSEEEFVKLGPWNLSPEYQPNGQLSSLKAQQAIMLAMELGYHFFEWTHTTIDGTSFPATVMLTRVELGDSVFLQATVRDITEQKRMAEELQRLREQLKQSGSSGQCNSEGEIK